MNYKNKNKQKSCIYRNYTSRWGLDIDIDIDIDIGVRWNLSMAIAFLGLDPKEKLTIYPEVCFGNLH
jgi:hypothetical protein